MQNSEIWKQPGNSHPAQFMVPQVKEEWELEYMREEEKETSKEGRERGMPDQRLLCDTLRTLRLQGDVQEGF